MKETEFLRLKRSKLGVDDFDPIKVIGRGAFGEVCILLTTAHCYQKKNYQCPQSRTSLGMDRALQGVFSKLVANRNMKKMVLISFEHLKNILIFPKFQLCSSKIVPATPFWILKFKRAWQAQFLSHNLVTLKNCVFFIGVQMILIPFFDTHNQKSKNLKWLVNCITDIPYGPEKPEKRVIKITDEELVNFNLPKRKLKNPSNLKIL